MAGKIDFAAALRERVAMLEGTPVAEVKALLERLTLQPGITELVDRCRKQRIPCYMVSGGFTILAEPLGEIVGMSGVRANRFGIRTQWEERQTAPLEVLSGQVEGPLVDAQGKRQYLLETCAQEGFAPSEVIAVGDGANDLLMIETALYGVGLKPKEALRPVLHLQNQLGDHRLLGYFLYGDLS